MLQARGTHVTRTHEVPALSRFAVFWRRAVTEHMPGARFGAPCSSNLILSINGQIVSTLSHAGYSVVPCLSSGDPASLTGRNPWHR